MRLNHLKAAFVVCELLIAAGAAEALGANSSIGGFIPFVGVGLTNQYATIEDPDVGAIFFIAEKSDTIGGTQLGVGGTPYYDVAILDTGAATHILTHEAFLGFNIQGAGFQGTETQQVGGAGGLVELEINDALGVYVAGLGDRTPSGPFAMQPNKLRGQTSFATLSAPQDGWTLPNIVGMPMAAQHSLVIRNDLPQIFPHELRTMRTPQVVLRDLGQGAVGAGPGNTNILRRTPLKLKPGIGFIQGPLYVFNLGIEDLLGGILDPEFELAFHDNPASPSVVENGGLFIDVDVANGSSLLEDKEFLFDTGADLSVISQLTAKRLGFDVVTDTPDFFLEVEGVGGISGGVPGIFLDTLNIDTVGGNFTLHNVPVAVLDLPNPNDPGNTLPGLIGMQPFNGRNLVIDANPAIGQGGVGPSLYISDPVTQGHNWATAAASGTWATAGNWGAPGTPDTLWDANVASVSGGTQMAVVASNSTVFRLTVSGTATASMTVKVNSGVTLTTFADTRLEAGGRIELAGGKLDTQLVEIAGGTLTGFGQIFVGSGPIRSPVRILEGRVEPGSPIGRLSIDGDYSQQEGGTLAIDLGGMTANTQHDQLEVSRNAFLDGTLSVSLVNSFSPSVGNTFTILTAAQVEGSFATEQLPAGFVWDVNYNAGNVVVSVVGLGLAGDYNRDGTVNAADYTVWRNNLHSSNPEADGDYSGTVNHGDYLVWKSQYGMSYGIGSASGHSNNVPEPTSALLLLMSAVAAATLRRRR